MSQPTSNRPDPAAAPKPATAKSRGGKRVTRRLILMSSAAILGVYAAGYFKTESAAQQVADQQAPVASTITMAASPTVPPALAQASVPTQAPIPTAIDTPVAQVATGTDPAAFSSPTLAAPTATAVPPTPTRPAPTPTPRSRYRDGKYTATGSSRHGDVQATVVIKGGRIVSANIDGCMTRYPCSVIQDLPGQVVQQQSANVDFISGASDSSSAYQEAVASALAQAQAS